VARGGGLCLLLGTIHSLADAHTQGTTTLGPGGMVLVEHVDFRTPGSEVADDQPATCISCNEAKAYLAWHSEKAGRAYRLLTEAEWEYAVQAGETRPYFYGGGQEDLCAYGNFADSGSVYSAAIAARCAEEPSRLHQACWQLRPERLGPLRHGR
jgi:formylglycine-generating enzyme required for sulfatase activity